MNKIDLLGQASLTEVKRGNLFYTWHLGWVDKSHAYGINSTLERAWEEVRNAESGKNIEFMLKMNQSGGKGMNIKFRVKAKGSKNSLDRKNQMLTTWKILSEKFEKRQASFPQGIRVVNSIFGILKGVGGLSKMEIDKIPSSFSTEDLVSNLIQFYSLIDNTTAKELVDRYGGRFDRGDEIPLSIVIWRHYHSRTFTPKSRNKLFFNDLVFLFGHYKLHSKIY